MKKRLVWQCVFLVLLSLAVRGVAAFVLGNRFDPATWEYEILTQNMLAGRGYVIDYRDYGDYYALLGPGYSLLTYAIYRVAGVNHVLMLGVQFVLMTGFSLIVFLLGRLLFERRGVAFCAAVLTTLHPGLIYYSATMLHQFNLYLPLFYGTLVCLILLHKTGKWRYAIAVGLLAGYSVLTRATILPVTVLSLLLVVLLGEKGAWRRRVGQAGLVLVVLVAVNVPWAFRNYRVFDQVMLAQTNKWESFWVGNNPHASGGHYRADGSLVLKTKPPEMQAALDASDSELRDNRIFRRYALEYVTEQPWHFAKGLLRKAVYFWWFYPHTGVRYPAYALLGYKIIYSALLVFLAGGLWLCWRRRLWTWRMVYPALFVAGIYGVHTLYFMEMRHRWTIEPVLILFAAVSVWALVVRIFPKAEGLIEP